MGKRKSKTKAKDKAKKQILDSYTIEGTGELIKCGDCVLIKPKTPKEDLYVARVKEILSNTKGEVKVRVTRYFRPEETKYGRQEFQGKREVLSSDWESLESVVTIEGKCKVHTEQGYTELSKAGDDDFFCRSKYDYRKGAFESGTTFRVYCTCDWPYNPDYPMIQCDICKRWFHPPCVGIMTIAEVEKMDPFSCKQCSSSTLLGFSYYCRIRVMRWSKRFK